MLARTVWRWFICRSHAWSARTTFCNWTWAEWWPASPVMRHQRTRTCPLTSASVFAWRCRQVTTRVIKRASWLLLTAWKGKWKVGNCHRLSVCLSWSMSLSLLPPPPLSLSLSACLCVSTCLCLCPPPSLSPSLSPPLSLSLSPAPSLPLSVSL